MSITLQIFIAWASDKRTAEHGEILTEHIDQTTVDRAATRDNAIAGDFLVLHAEIDAIMFDIGVELFERAFIEQDQQPFARGQTALGMLRVDTLLSTTHLRSRAAAFEFCNVR